MFFHIMSTYMIGFRGKHSPVQQNYGIPSWKGDQYGVNNINITFKIVSSKLGKDVSVEKDRLKLLKTLADDFVSEQKVSSTTQVYFNNYW